MSLSMIVSEYSGQLAPVRALERELDRIAARGAEAREREILSEDVGARQKLAQIGAGAVHDLALGGFAVLGVLEDDVDRAGVDDVVVLVVADRGVVVGDLGLLLEIGLGLLKASSVASIEVPTGVLILSRKSDWSCSGISSLRSVDTKTIEAAKIATETPAR